MGRGHGNHSVGGAVGGGECARGTRGGRCALPKILRERARRGDLGGVGAVSDLRRLDEIITLLATEKGTSKALVARELLSQGLNQVLFPVLAQLYEDGKISIKKIIALTKLHPVEVLELLPKYLKKSPITPDIDKYTSGVTEKIIARLKHKE